MNTTKTHSYLEPQMVLKEKDNILEQTPPKSESKSFCLKEPLSQNENILALPQVNKKLFTTGDENCEFNQINQINDTNQSSECQMEKEILIGQEPLKELSHQLPGQTFSQNENASSLKRTHTPNKPNNLSPHKKILLELNQNNKKSVNELGKSSEKYSNDCLSSPEKDSLEDNMKVDRGKIKKRRSSLGRFTVTSDSTQSCNSEIQVANVAQNDFTTELSSQNMESPSRKDIETDSIKSKNEEQLVKKYNEMSEKLMTEYHSWNQLRKMRKQKVREAHREVKEAKEMDTLIDEDILPHLNSEQKAILLSGPDYRQYLKEVNFALERLTLTQLKVERASRCYQSFMKACKITSQCCFEIMEDQLLGELKEQDTKVLLKALMNCGINDAPLE